VSNKFSCPNCGKSLVSNERVIFIYTFVIWTLGELIIRGVVWSYLADGWFRVILFAALSGCFGFTVHYFLLRNGAEIEVRTDST